MNKLTIFALSLLLTPCIAISKEEKVSDVTEKITTKELAEHATFWISQLPKLSHEEMSLLCNFLYLESLSLGSQTVTQKTLINIHTASARMNKQLAVNEADAKKIALETSKQLNDLQNELLPMRAFLLKANKDCLNTIEQSDYTTLKKVIIGYQQYARAVIAQFINQDKPAILQILNQTKAGLESHLKTMTEYTKTLGAVLNDANPYMKEGIDRNVCDMDVSMALADSALGTLSETTVACAIAKSMSTDILSICVTFNTIFYNTLFNALQQDKSLLPIYLMFDENGFIEEDDRKEELSIINEKTTVHKKHLKS